MVSGAISLLQRLLYARRAGRLSIVWQTALMSVLRSFLPAFRQRWPDDSWSDKVLANRLTILKKLWRIYREVRNTTGTAPDENHETLLNVSGTNRRKIIEKFGAEGKKILREGLPVDDIVTLDAWAEIFQDDPPAGRHIHPPGDERFWQGQAEARGNAPLPGHEEEEADSPTRTEPTIIAVDGPTQVLSSEDDIAVFSQATRVPETNPASQVPLLAQMPRSTAARPPPRARQRAGGDSSGGNTVPNEALNTARQRRRTGVSWEEMRDMLADKEVNRRHIVVPRPEGCEDIERAVSDCIQVLQPRGLELVMRVVDVISSNSTYAVVWNSLSSLEAKEAAGGRTRRTGGREVVVTRTWAAPSTTTYLRSSVSASSSMMRRYRKAGSRVIGL